MRVKAQDRHSHFQSQVGLKANRENNIKSQFSQDGFAGWQLYSSGFLKASPLPRLHQELPCGDYLQWPCSHGSTRHCLGGDSLWQLYPYSRFCSGTSRVSTTSTVIGLRITLAPNVSHSVHLENQHHMDTAKVCKLYLQSSGIIST